MHILNEGVEMAGDGRQTPTHVMWPSLKEHNILSDAFNKIVHGETIQKFVINEMSELSNVFKQIDY